MLPAASSFCFGRFVFKVTVSVSYFYRHASPEATKRFPAVNLLRHVNLFIGGDCSGYEKFLQVVPPWKKRFGNTVLHCDHPCI